MQQIREYKILEKIGEGGMGVVYKAFDNNLDRYVAIKAIHVIHTSNTELVQRFRQEAKVQASLVHPNIVSLYNFFAEGDIYYMIMEYVEGETLSQRLKHVGLLPPHKCIPIFLQVLQAVEYAHLKGIVHRDIKPSNILIYKNDNIKVMDFGIAKVIGDKSMTKTGTKMGTLNFMSPEQVLGEKDIDARSDIFSLGITFFEMLTGQLPYNTQTESDFKLMQQIVDNEMPSVKKYYPYVPDKVDYAISKATRKSRYERFQSCKEFYDYIKFEEINEQQEVAKKEITIVPLITKPPKIKIAEYYNDLKSVSSSANNTHPKEFPKASLGKRFGALFLEAIIFGIPWAVIITRIDSRGSSDNSGIIGVFFLSLFLVIIMKDGIRNGKGIGKGMLNLRLINSRDFCLVTKARGTGRTLLSGLFTAIYFIGFMIDLIFVFADPQGRKIADFMLGTQVVNEDDIVINGGKVYPK